MGVGQVEVDQDVEAGPLMVEELVALVEEEGMQMDSGQAEADLVDVVQVELEQLGSVEVGAV